MTLRADRRGGLQLATHESEALHGLRGFAAIVVVVAHVVSWFVQPYYEGLETLMHLLAASAVMLFFVLSGFFVTSSILNNIRRNGAFSARSYVAGRLARLYPVLLLAVAVTAASYLTIVTFDLACASGCGLPGQLHTERDRAQLKLPNIGGTLVFINGMVPKFSTPSMNGPLWSLSHEFWFYMLAGLAATGIQGRVGWRAIASTACLGLLASSLLFKNWTFVLGLVVWSMGSAACLLRTGQQRLGVSGQRLLTVAAGVFGLVGFADYVANQRSTSYYIIGLSFGLGFLAVSRRQTLPTCTAVRRLAPTSKYSYTLYAIHWPLIQLAYASSIEAYDAWGWMTRLAFLAALMFVVVALSAGLAGLFEDTARARKVGARIAGWLVRTAEWVFPKNLKHWITLEDPIS